MIILILALFLTSKETYFLKEILIGLNQFSPVQSLSRVRLSATPWIIAPTRSRSLLKFMSIKSVMPSRQPSHPLSSPSPPAPNPSQHQGLSNESTLRMRWPKFWSFSFSIRPSSEHPGLISFRMDSLDFLAFQGTFKSFLQHHSINSSTQLSSQSNSHIHTWPLENHSLD